MTAPLARRLRRAAARLDAQGMSIGAMARAHGAAAPGTLLLLMAAPCLLPVPGVGTALGLGLAALALAFWRGRWDDCLPRRVARLELPAHCSRRVLMFLVSAYLLAGRHSRTRLAGWVCAPDRAWVAATIAAMAVLIVLPIPFGNILPALALMFIGLAFIHRDGVAMILGLGTAALALALTCGLALLAWDLGSGWLLS